MKIPVLFFLLILLCFSQNHSSFYHKIKDSIFPLLTLYPEKVPVSFKENFLLIQFQNRIRRIGDAELFEIHKILCSLPAGEKISWMKNYLFQPSRTPPPRPNNSLKKKPKVLIDPGHFACNFREAIYEKKFLKIHPFDPLLGNADTLYFFEAYLTGLTAELLKILLENEGFEIILTRPVKGGSAFGICYEEFFHHPELYERKFSDIFNPQKKQINYDPNSYAREIFRDADLIRRKKIIESTRPDLIISIHYNVDEENKPWTRSVKKNYTMAFIPGAFDSISRSDTSKLLHFLTLLLDNTMENSILLSSQWIKQIASSLSVRPALPDDASYLKKLCVYTHTPGVFARNLAITNSLPVPVLYGEAYLMDCQEMILDFKKTIQWKNCNYPGPVYLTAKAYAESIRNYFNKK